jgi:arsenate reductase (thioredoxin)
MDKTRVLFVCVHNSARSQMAEAFLKSLAGDRFEAMSAGIEPGTMNPLAVEAMKEVGIDMSGGHTKSVFDLLDKGEPFSYVITVCDAAAEACPFFPGLLTKQIHWSFDDPSAFTGTQEERLVQTRIVRDAIKERIRTWLRESSNATEEHIRE